MREDELENLLRHADGDIAPLLADPRELARRVRHLDASRRRRTRLVSTAGALGIALAIVWAVRPTDVAVREVAQAPVEVAGVPQVDAKNPDELPDVADDIRLVLLEGEIAQHERTAQLMMADLASERALKVVRYELKRGNPLEEVRQQLDTVAFRMISEADRLQAEMREPAEAVAIYNDVIRLFPTTYSAQLARQRLSNTGI